MEESSACEVTGRGCTKPKEASLDPKRLRGTKPRDLPHLTLTLSCRLNLTATQSLNLSAADSSFRCPQTELKFVSSSKPASRCVDEHYTRHQMLQPFVPIQLPV